MYLYNVTYIVEQTIAPTWLEEMTNIHIPQVMATQKFVSNRLLKVMDSPNEGVTYCLQFIAENAADLADYQKQFEPQQQQDLFAKFENKFVFFSTVMKFIA